MTDVWMIVVGAGFALMLTAIVLLWRQLRQLKTQLHLQQQILQNCNDDLLSLCSAAAHVDRTLSHFEERLGYLSQPVVSVVTDRPEVMNTVAQESHTDYSQDSFSSSPEHTEVSGYQAAIQKIHQGASIEELVKTCALTRDEALLLMRVHGR